MEDFWRQTEDHQNETNRTRKHFVTALIYTFLSRTRENLSFLTVTTASSPNFQTTEEGETEDSFAKI